MRHAIDLLVEARWIIPIEPANTVLEHHAVAVSQGKILAILPIAEAHERFSARDHHRLETHALLPGFINLHTHAAMSLMRGIADDLPLMDWLQNHIWPAEQRFLTEEFVESATLLASAEMLKGGITCFNDMYFFADAAIAAAKKTGQRMMAGITVLEFPTNWAPDASTYLEKGLAIRDENRSDPRIGFCLAPHAPYTVSNATFERIFTLSEQLQLPIHLHVHETADEINNSLREHGVRPLTRLERFGLLSPNLIGVHAVHLLPDEISQLAYFGCHIAHCPNSNLKLASGIAPLAALNNAGVNVGLGTDGAASNNRLDLWSEMRTASLLAKGQSGDPTAISAHQALAMATLNGARALGLEETLGSLRFGKWADMVAVNFDHSELMPVYDVVSHLAYVTGREHVSHVFVEGELLVRDHQLTRLEESELRHIAGSWQNRLKH